jgi:hypothetical protein
VKNCVQIFVFAAKIAHKSSMQIFIRAQIGTICVPDFRQIFRLLLTKLNFKTLQNIKIHIKIGNF